MDLERLKRLAQRGDRDAACHLYTAARRHGDDGGVSAALAHLNVRPLRGLLPLSTRDADRVMAAVTRACSGANDSGWVVRPEHISVFAGPNGRGFVVHTVDTQTGREHLERMMRSCQTCHPGCLDAQRECSCLILLTGLIFQRDYYQLIEPGSKDVAQLSPHRETRFWMELLEHELRHGPRIGPFIDHRAEQSGLIEALRRWRAGEFEAEEERPAEPRRQTWWRRLLRWRSAAER